MRRLKIGDRILRVRDEGDGRHLSGRPPLVCIHGAGSSSVVWMDTVRALSGARRVVALDLPAHGQSDPWHEVSIELYRDAVGTVCAHLGIERAVLVGHSMGGLVAQACAAAWPERVAGLMLCATSDVMPVDPEVLGWLTNEPATYLDRFGPLAWSAAAPGELVEKWTRLAFSAEPSVMLADLRAVDRHDGRALASRIRAPTVILAGTDDLLTPLCDARRLAGAIPGARLIELDGTGHLPMLERPETLYAELRALPR